jgi:hypothetical protein
MSVRRVEASRGYHLDPEQCDRIAIVTNRQVNVREGYNLLGVGGFCPSHNLSQVVRWEDVKAG